MRRADRLRSLVPIVGLALALSACGPPANRYVRDPDNGAAFKLPAGWTIFDEAELLGRTDGTTEDTGDAIEWLVGFDAAPSPAPGHVLGVDGTIATDHPTGIARVDVLTPEQRSQISLGHLRNVVIPVDEIGQQDDGAALQVIAYDDTIVEDGLRGVHLEFVVTEAAIAEARSSGNGGGGGGGGGASGSTELVHVTQTAFVDEATSRMFLLAVMCSDDCFARYRGDIDAALDSWTVVP